MRLTILLTLCCVSLLARAETIEPPPHLMLSHNPIVKQDNANKANNEYESYQAHNILPPLDTPAAMPAWVSKQPALRPEQIEQIDIQLSELIDNSYQLTIRFTPQGARLLQQLTAQHLGEKLVIGLPQSRQILLAPHITQTVDSGTLQLTGIGSPHEAHWIAEQWRKTGEMRLSKLLAFDPKQPAPIDEELWQLAQLPTTHAIDLWLHTPSTLTSQDIRAIEYHSKTQAPEWNGDDGKRYVITFKLQAALPTTLHNRDMVLLLGKPSRWINAPVHCNRHTCSITTANAEWTQTLWQQLKVRP